MARLVLLGALGLLVSVYAAPDYSIGGNKGIGGTTREEKAGGKDDHALGIVDGGKGTEGHNGNTHSGVTRSDSNTNDPDKQENSRSENKASANDDQGTTHGNGDGNGYNSGGTDKGGSLAVKNSESNNNALSSKGHETGYDSDVNAGNAGKEAARYRRDESRDKGNTGDGGRHRGGSGGGGNDGKNAGGSKGGRHRRSTDTFDLKSKGGNGGSGGGKGGGGGHGGRHHGGDKEF